MSIKEHRSYMMMGCYVLLSVVIYMLAYFVHSKKEEDVFSSPLSDSDGVPEIYERSTRPSLEQRDKDEYVQNPFKNGDQ